MKSRRKKRWVAVVLCLAVVLAVGTKLWIKYCYQGTRDYESISPDGRYKLVIDKTFSFRQLIPVAPGQGSDNQGGYVRVYRSDGRKLHEVWASNGALSVMMVRWDTKKMCVYTGLPDDQYDWVWKLQ